MPSGWTGRQGSRVKAHGWLWHRHRERALWAVSRPALSGPQRTDSTQHDRSLEGFGGVSVNIFIMSLTCRQMDGGHAGQRPGLPDTVRGHFSRSDPSLTKGTGRFSRGLGVFRPQQGQGQRQRGQRPHPWPAFRASSQVPTSGQPPWWPCALPP